MDYYQVKLRSLHLCGRSQIKKFLKHLSSTCEFSWCFWDVYRCGSVILRSNDYWNLICYIKNLSSGHGRARLTLRLTRKSPQSLTGLSIPERSTVTRMSEGPWDSHLIWSDVYRVCVCVWLMVHHLYHQIITVLEEDSTAQKMQLGYRLQQIAAAVENKVTDLWQQNCWDNKRHLLNFTPLRGLLDGADGQSGDCRTSIITATVWRKRKGVLTFWHLLVWLLFVSALVEVCTGRLCFKSGSGQTRQEKWITFHQLQQGFLRVTVISTKSSKLI